MLTIEEKKTIEEAQEYLTKLLTEVLPKLSTETFVSKEHLLKELYSTVYTKYLVLLYYFQREKINKEYLESKEITEIRNISKDPEWVVKARIKEKLGSKLSDYEGLKLLTSIYYQIISFLNSLLGLEEKNNNN